MNLEKIALSVIQKANNGCVQEQTILDISDDNNLSLAEFSQLCDLITETGIRITAIDPLNETKNVNVNQEEICDEIIELFSLLTLNYKKKCYLALGNKIEYFKEDKEYPKKELQFDDIDSFTSFCQALDNCDYNITLNKTILLEKAKMTPVIYKKLNDELDSLRFFLKDYKTCMLIYERKTNKSKNNPELKKLINIRKSNAFNQLKIIKSIFNVEYGCRRDDIDFLVDHCISKDYKSSNENDWGFKIKICGTISLLNYIMKLLSINKKWFISNKPKDKNE